VESDPFETFPDRFMEAAMAGGHDLIFISQVMFGSGRCFDRIERLAALSLPGGPWVVIDGYHAFMAIPELFGAGPAASTFYLGGGYKYAMAGEGCAFLHAPPDFGPRPPVTGWYAEIERLDGSSAEVAYPEDGFRFIGATFDASGLYRFNAVQRMLEQNDLSTARISEHVRGLQGQLLHSMRGTVLAEADLLNPLGNEPHARFLAFRDARAAGWRDDLARENCIVDVRGNVLRVGLGLYHDSEDVAAFAVLAGRLQ
jgi:selenocysteine lyase/cysteine desulfurase